MRRQALWKWSLCTATCECQGFKPSSRCSKADNTSYSQRSRNPGGSTPMSACALKAMTLAQLNSGARSKTSNCTICDGESRHASAEKRFLVIRAASSLCWRNCSASRNTAKSSKTSCVLSGFGTRHTQASRNTTGYLHTLPYRLRCVSS